MKRSAPIRCAVVSALFLLLVNDGVAHVQATAFTYQGKLTDAGNPANGNYDLQFKLFDALSGGTQQGVTITNPTVAVSNGVFTVTLDFGANVFSSATRFLEIGVRPAGSVNAYTVLAPRQPITSTPYAIQTLKAASADALSSTCVGCVQDAQINAVAGSKVTGTIPVAGVPAGSTNYIQNTAILQASSNFNISGNGFIGGNLGIGTTTPATPLEVNGLLRSTRNGVAPQYLQLWGGDNSSIRLTGQSTGGAEKPLLIQNLSGEVTPGIFNTIHFQVGTTAAPATKMIIDKDGNVGIGITTPTTKLYALSSTPGLSAIYGESATGRGVWGKSTSSRGVYGESTSLEGVYGISNSGTGVVGASTSNSGVYGESAAVNTLAAAGVYGKATGSGGIGVVGEANLNNAVGVFGMSTSPGGYGVYARNLSGGLALYSEGSAGQPRNKGGFVKAMVRVRQDGVITSCYNSQTNSSTGDCGLSVTRLFTGQYLVDFHFQVNDRLLSLSPEGSFGTTNNNPITTGANYYFAYYQYITSVTQVVITTFILGESGGADVNFMLVIY